MELAFLVGRIVVGGFFLMNGMNHFMKTADMARYTRSKGVPAAGAAVLLSGLMLLAGGLSLLLGYLPRVGVAILVVFLVPTAFLMHDFWKLEDPQAQMAEMGNFMKNLALAGALLMTLPLETWPYSLGS